MQQVDEETGEVAGEFAAGGQQGASGGLSPVKGSKGAGV